MSTSASISVTDQGATCVVTVQGTWAGAPPLETASVLERLHTTKAANVLLRTKDLNSWDSSLLVFLVQIVRLAQMRKISVQKELPEGLDRLLALTFAVKAQEGAKREQRQAGFFERVGGSVLSIGPSVRDFFQFLYDVLCALCNFLLGRATMRREDFLACVAECSLQALPIVAITNLLFGLILAFVGAVQLTQFGVEIYVAGLVGIGMLRVMGAVMVGIVMSGRVGASYAALLGTMQVNEEIDALVTFGFSPIEFLVLPRMLALALMVPLLTLYADCMGILGGFIVGTFMLGLNPLEYIDATCRMVKFSHGIIGLVYATMFGIVIAISGCYHGIRCGRSAQAVGQATTTAVVHSIVGIIIMTAIITIVCNILHV